MSTRPKVVCIVGPTACHKTELSIRLAEQFEGEIISTDSVAVYRGLDIGSAKPTMEERHGIPHHMLDCVSVDDVCFSVAVFRDMARKAIAEIVGRNKLPIVVGGSGMYCDAVFSDMTFSAPSDPAIRLRLESEYGTSPMDLWERLQRIDPMTAMRLHPNDAKRIIRALEVYEVTGQTFSELNRSFADAQKANQEYDVIRIGLNMDRQRLYQRIELRVDKMFDMGLVQEAFDLFDKGYSTELPAMQAIGYAQLRDVYDGKCTLEEAKERIKSDTRHFAKRQLTWFRRDKNTRWFPVDAYESVPDLMMEISNYLEVSLQ